LRVLARRLEAAGWEYRIFSGSVPADELVASRGSGVSIVMSGNVAGHWTDVHGEPGDETASCRG